MASLARSLLLTNTTTTTTSVPPSIPPPPPKPFRPSVAIMVGAVATVFSLTFLLLLYLKHCRRSQYPSSHHHRRHSHLMSSSHRNSGLHRSVVDSLPLFRFSSLLGHPKKHGLECAVCLSPFLPSDLLRLLPHCCHAFHVECVDTWLDSHSSCPLCRSRVHPDDLLLLPFEPPLPPRPSRRHSSAGERSTNPRSTTHFNRKSVDDGLLRAAPQPPRRKDGLLHTTEGCPMATDHVEEEAMEKRFAHCIVISAAGDHGDAGNVVRGDRWSDLRPSDLLFLRSEMILTPGGRPSSPPQPPAIPGRCESDLTGVGRRAAGGRRAEEQLALRRWLSSAATRWLGGGVASRG